LAEHRLRIPCRPARLVPDSTVYRNPRGASKDAPAVPRAPSL
jgi:hypothetical protein